MIYRKIFGIFDLPAEILSDRESYFANKIIQNLCKIVKLTYKFSIPYEVYMFFFAFDSASDCSI